MKVLAWSLCSLLIAVASAQKVTNLQLVNTDTGATITSITNNAKIPMPSYGLSIAAITTGSIGSVKFSHNSKPNFHIENFVPYMLCADKSGTPFPCSMLSLGTHTITATPFSQRKGAGTAGTALTITFTLVAEGSPPVPTLKPTPAPVQIPVAAPVPAPVAAPVPAPVQIPVAAPVPVSNPGGGSFQEVFINCGGPEYTDAEGNVWVADSPYVGGEDKTYETDAEIGGTTYDPLYQTERWGLFSYSIPLPPGDYQVILHFAEIYHIVKGKRSFSLDVGDVNLPSFDIADQAGGPLTAMTREIATLIDGGKLAITPMAILDNPKISAIHIKAIAPHLAHAVAGGPYTVVNSSGSGTQDVKVDGSQSHTHGIGLELTAFEWKIGSTVLGRKAEDLFKLPIGTHDVTLKVTDDGGNVSIDSTVIQVLPDDFPDISSISPNDGQVSGGDQVTILGSGFSSATGVQFGQTFLSGNQISVVNSGAIIVTSPGSNVAVPVSVSVVAATGSSKGATFTYIGNVPIKFDIKKLDGFSKPSAIRFAPNGDLYVGNLNGELGRFKLDASFTKVVSKTIKKVAGGRFILGIAFNPLETADTVNPPVYISSSNAFHGEDRDSFGNAINGKIQVVTGADLGKVTDLVTGLPVSDHDHCINGIEFGDNGELYIQLGGNTNGGIPGELSGSQKMKENYFSAATLVAHLGKSGFDGFITYTSEVEGKPKSGFGPNGVQIYASGMRNPFGIVKHSNGRLYGTDNGPNGGFGDMATGCNPGQQKPDQYKKDELNLIEAGKWYGHPNFARAKHDSDSKQCVWNGSGHTPPLMELNSSTDGIIEFESDHFGGQLRENLIMSKYKDGLYRVVLNQAGTGVDPSTNPATLLGGDNSLDITQAPNGVIIDARLPENAIYYYKPVEPTTSAMQIKSVFPRKGRTSGGSTLNIYGINFPAGTPAVKVGGKNCGSAVRVSDTLVKCSLPGGSQGSRVNVVVSIAGDSDTMTKAYRYIKGTP